MCTGESQWLGIKRVMHNNVKILLHAVLNDINSTVRTLHLIKTLYTFFLLPVEVISHFC